MQAESVLIKKLNENTVCNNSSKFIYLQLHLLALYNGDI